MNPAVELAGLRLKNPVLTASGTFGYGVEFAPYGDLTELGGIVVKGLSWEPRAGNPMPRIAETPCGMLNAIGLQNIGAHRFVAEKLPLLPWAEVPVIANLYACDVEDFARLAEYLAGQEGVAALEVNISCPNVQAGGILFGQDPGQAARVTRAVKEKAGTKPVIVKLSPNVTDITSVAKAAADGGADILALINTLSGMAVDVRTRMPRLANVIGGLSGPAIKPVGLRCVHQVSRAVDLPIIGLGGIASAEDVLEYILVGAWAVQIGTANFLRPDTAFRIAADLPKLLDDLGVTSWEEFRGALRA
ncbi:dihydroorotate dehydrogenase [Desulfonatronum lacustre]|uniref:dihydroorotate dehydrogenase n=1 Tax=Desulfonatronum lacustre TaxID=66849 RepID=UPI00048D7C36|nr:dihydroorotate dehydrogenase [Desulfonatronum lacustre]SMP51711.1 dihydroorotate oxidase B, catalytic subunit [Desulfonatronum zhilinae]